MLSVIGLLAVVVVLSYRIGKQRFDRKVRREVRAIIDTAEVRTGVVSAEDFTALPKPVRRYFRYVGVEGKRLISLARLRHGGTFLMGQRWVPVEGEYCYTVDLPSFIWYASLNVAPGLRIKVRDRYHKGEGNVLAKALPLVTLADAKGREVDEGSLLRYLSEAPLLPTAL